MDPATNPENPPVAALLDPGSAFASESVRETREGRRAREVRQEQNKRSKSREILWKEFVEDHRVEAKETLKTTRSLSTFYDGEN